MLIVDSHLDLAWNAIQWDRDLQLPIEVLRRTDASLPGPGRGQGTVSLPELHHGRVAVCFATLLARSTGKAVPGVDFSSPAQACGAALGQLEYYRALEGLGLVRILTDLPGLEAHIAEWQAWEQGSQADPPPLGFVIAMESADPIPAPEHLYKWKQAGVRVIGPAHYGSGRYAGGTGCEEGLPPAGRALIGEMDRLGILLDLTHFTDRAIGEALELYRGPVLASHNNCRAIVPGQRQFSDEQLRLLVERGGVIGVALDAWMLRPGWVRGAANNPPASLENAVDHIDHICQLAGNARHAALGSDLDGGFGREQAPADLNTIADLQKFTKLLAQRGYRDDDIAAVMHGNWLRLLRTAWNS